MAIRIQHEGALARITLARPPLNILDVDLLGDLADAIEAAHAAAVILLGAEGKCFSAGNDVKDHTRERAPAMLRAFHRAIRGLLTSNAITIADVSGDALGGGCELVSACDLAYAVQTARFGQPEIDVGCFPPVAAALLPRRIGWTHAVELIATGRRIDADEAARLGLITAVGEAQPVVESLLAKSPSVLRTAKMAIRAGNLADAEEVYLHKLLPLDDCEEGVRAFLEKRPPRWS